MNKNIRMLVLVITVGFPMMVFFQNCGQKQDFSQLESTSATDLSRGDVNNPPSSSGGNQPVSIDLPITIGGPVEHHDEIDDNDEYEKACTEYENFHESENMSVSDHVSADKKSVTGIQGKHMIMASRDLGGSNQLEMIDGVNGKLIVCGLKVNKITNSFGSLILVRSQVQECINHNGDLKASPTSIYSECPKKGGKK